MSSRNRRTGERNAFRVLGLPVDAGERRIVARLDELRAEVAAGGGAGLDAAAVEAAALRLRQPDLRLVDGLVWEHCDLLLQAQMATNGPAQRLRALTACVKALAEQIADASVGKELAAAGLSTAEAGALCAGQLRTLLREAPDVDCAGNRAATKALAELAAAIQSGPGFVCLSELIRSRPAPGLSPWSYLAQCLSEIRDAIAKPLRRVAAPLRVVLRNLAVTALCALPFLLAGLDRIGGLSQRPPHTQQTATSTPVTHHTAPAAAALPSRQELTVAVEQARLELRAAREARQQAIRELDALMAQDEAAEDEEPDLGDLDDDADLLSDPGDETYTDEEDPYEPDDAE